MEFQKAGDKVFEITINAPKIAVYPLFSTNQEIPVLSWQKIFYNLFKHKE